MKKYEISIFVLMLLTSPFGLLRAQSIVVQDARDSSIPIAVQEFLREPPTPEIIQASVDIEAMLSADLIFSRLFKLVPQEAFAEQKVSGPIEVLRVDLWKSSGADYVVRARLKKVDDAMTMDAYVFNTLSGKTLLKRTYQTRRKDYTILAHQLGDDIVELVTGEKGLFSTKIAFVYQPPGSRLKEVWAMDFNGRNSVPLVQNGRTNLSPKWTIDGRDIVYTTESLKGWNLSKTSLGGKSSSITSVPGSALGPTMLPNGRDMVVSLSKDGNNELYIVGLDGKIKERLTKRDEIDIAPSVSPDGKKICFSSGIQNALHVYIMELATKTVNKITRVGIFNDTCAWHPKENRILFSGMDLDREFDIFAMDDQGNNMERLTYDAKNNEAPDWSPDGKLIVFGSRRSGRYEIFVMRADGTQVVKITDLPGAASQPTWSPRLGY